MKTIPVFRKRLFALLATGFFLGFLVLTACTKGDISINGNVQLYATSGDASGAQENPPVNSSGTGTFTGTYNATSNMWQYAANWSALSNTATAVEIHGPADIGIDGNLLFAITINTPGINGSAGGNATLTAQQETDLLAGKCYYTVLTATHITGEIRGQIYATAQ